MGVVQFQILQQAIRVPLPRHLQNEPRSIPKNLQLIAWWSSSTLLGERSKWFLALPGNRLPVRSENNSADEPTSRRARTWRIWRGKRSRRIFFSRRPGGGSQAIYCVDDWISSMLHQSYFITFFPHLFSRNANKTILLVPSIRSSLFAISVESQLQQLLEKIHATFLATQVYLLHVNNS